MVVLSSVSKKPPVSSLGCSAMTNEPVLPSVAPHSEGCEFPLQIDKYRDVVEEAVFQCVGKPVFCDEAVEAVMKRIAAGIERERPTANGGSTSCAFAETPSRMNPIRPTDEELRRLIQAEARSLAREIEAQFARMGIL
jgi:hypothetical protein